MLESAVQSLRKPGAIGGAAGVVAGMLWLVIWAHQMIAHGPTSVNEGRLALGLTWMDSGKFVVVPLAFVLVMIVSLYVERANGGILGAVALTLTSGALLLMIAGAALQFWAFPWGSYDVSFETAGDLTRAGGIVQSMSSIAFTLGSALCAADAFRGRWVPWPAAILLPVGAATTFFLTPVFFVPGVVWIIVGAALIVWCRRLPPVRGAELTRQRP